MKITAKPVADQKGMVELYADGKKVDGVYCRPGSARVSGGMIEFVAYIKVPPFAKTESQYAAVSKEGKGENNNK